MDKSYFTPNDFTGADDSAVIQAAVDEASRTGCNAVTIPAYNRRTDSYIWVIERSIELPSHFYLEINNAHLRMADGVICQMFRNSNAMKDIGKNPEGLQEDIRIHGVGRAILDGGKHNGCREKTWRVAGMPHIMNNLTIYMHNVKNFKIDGLYIRDQRWWALCFIYAWDGVISDLHFEITDKSVRESQDHPWRNQDGIDLRIGCHDIQIHNLTGETCDDIVALTALAVSETAFENEYRCPHLSSDIYNVSIRNITGFNNHCAMVRLLCHNHNCIRNINIDNLTDTTPYNGTLVVNDCIRTASCVKIGEDDYYQYNPDIRCKTGEMSHINISNVFSNALAAVVMNCEAKDVSIRNVHVGQYGGHAVAVTKIKAGVYQRLDEEANHTYCENITADGIYFDSQRENACVCFTVGLKAKNFKFKNVNVTGGKPLLREYRKQPGTEEIIFEDVTEN